jgi:hypothetical protein
VPQQDADIFEVLIGQVAKGRESDPVLGEATGRTPTCRAFRATPLWAPDDSDKEFLVSGLRLDEEGGHGRPHSVPGRLEHLGAWSPTPRLASPAAPSARWSQCTSWHAARWWYPRFFICGLCSANASSLEGTPHAKAAATLRAGNTRPYLFVIPCRPQITGRNLLGAVADRAPTCIVSF